MISDAQTLEAQLESMDSGESLDTGITLSLITLQQRAASQNEESALQIQVDQILRVDLSKDEVIEILRNLSAALEGQNLQLEGEISLLENKISNLALSVERESFQIEQLSQERDLARKIYLDLSTLVEQTRVNISQK